MTTTTKRKPKNSAQTDKPNFTMRPTIEQINEQFRSAVKIDKASNMVEAFLYVADFLRQNTKSFDWTDFIHRSKIYEQLENLSVCKTLFDQWIKIMEDAKMIQTVNGCYDTPIYLNT